MRETIKNSITAHREVLDKVNANCVDDIENISEQMVRALNQHQTIFWCGNGGSAADCQHLAAELIGRFTRERSAISSIALTTDTSILTCVGNDYSFDDIFVRQVEGLARKGDIVVGLSTSGNSENVLRAIEKANGLGAVTIGILGKDGGVLGKACRHTLIVPSDNTARIQEMHILIGHIVCDLVEAAWASH